MKSKDAEQFLFSRHPEYKWVINWADNMDALLIAAIDIDGYSFTLPLSGLSVEKMDHELLEVRELILQIIGDSIVNLLCQRHYK